MPRVIGECSSYGVFVGCLYDEDGARLVVGERAAEQHEFVVDQPVHEVSVLVPARLLFQGQAGSPLGPRAA